MKKQIVLFFLASALSFTSCISTKVFNDLEARYSEMKINRNALLKYQDSLQQAFNTLDKNWYKTSAYLKRSRDSVSIGLEQITSLEEEYALLAQNSNKKINESIARNNSLLKEIAIKESQLFYFANKCCSIQSPCACSSARPPHGGKTSAPAVARKHMVR